MSTFEGVGEDRGLKNCSTELLSAMETLVLAGLYPSRRAGQYAPFSTSPGCLSEHLRQITVQSAKGTEYKMNCADNNGEESA